MKTPSRLDAVLLFLLLAPAAWGQNLDLRSETRSQTNFLGVLGESATFSLPEGKILGSGLRAEFDHSFARDFSFDLFLSTAFTGDGGQASFTGIGGALSYNLLGECCASERQLSVSGRTILVEKKELGTLLQAAIGADQFFLNGSKAVYSASGLSFGLNCDFTLWTYRFRAGARHSSLVANQTSMTGLFFNLGLLFSL